MSNIQSAVIEKLKSPLRKIFHPPYLLAINKILNNRYAEQMPFAVDQWYWNSRGMLRSRLHKQAIQLGQGVAGKRVLVVGCGKGADTCLWLNQAPALLVGVDYLNYREHWAGLLQHYRSEKTEIQFFQENIKTFQSEGKFDFIVSDAVFEHLYEFEACLKNMVRILAPGGIIYAAFGPLWSTWGGDHISGYDELRSGFNHLILSREEHERYLESAGPFATEEDDGRTWIKENLFSYLRFDQYVECLEKQKLQRLFCGVEISSEAVKCLNLNLNVKEKLLETYRFMDLIIKGMVLIYQKS